MSFIFFFVVNPLVVRGRGPGQVEFDRKINKVCKQLFFLKIEDKFS
jgi:hypothetical protein